MIPSAQPAEVALREFDQFCGVDDAKLRRDAMWSLEDRAEKYPLRDLWPYLENDAYDLALEAVLLIACRYNEEALERITDRIKGKYDRAMAAFQAANVDDEMARLREEEE